MLRRDRQKRFVYSVTCFFLLIFFKVEIVVFFVEFLKQIFCVFTPRTEMIFVEHDNIPVCGVDKFVFRLYAARFVRAEQILKRTENNDRIIFITSVELFV